MKKPVTKFAFAAACAVALATGARAQTGSVGVGTTTPDASAQLDVASTNKGFLMPRVTTTQRGNIATPAKGLMIFNTTTNQVEVNTGTTASPVWTAVGAGAGATFDSTVAGNGLSMGTTNPKQVRLGGTLDAPTTITQGSNALTFSGAGAVNVLSGAAATNGSLSVGRTAAEGDFGVAGTANGFLTGTAAGDVALDAATNNLFMGTSSAKDVVIATNNAERMRVTSEGYVGIGTNNPLAPLQMGATTGVRKIVMYESTPNIANDTNFYGFGVTSGLMRYQVPSARRHAFFVNSDELMRLNAAGLAVGGTTQAAKLDVEGGIATATDVITAATTLTPDNSTVLCNTTAGAFTLTLPTASSCSGRIYTIKKVDASTNALTFSQPIGIDDATVTTANMPTTLVIQSNGAAWVKIN